MTKEKRIRNTPQNKAKFFGLYNGQKTMKWHQWTNPSEYSVVGEPPMQSKNGVDNGWYLELGQLSDISDQDAMDLMYLIEEKHWVDRLEDKAGWGKSFVEKFESKKLTQYTTELMVDYLRFKGYALPFMGIGVDTMVEYGWIRLKEQ